MQSTKKSFLLCLLTLFAFPAHINAKSHLPKKGKPSKVLMGAFVISNCYLLLTLQIKPNATILSKASIYTSHLIAHASLIKILWDLQDQEQKGNFSRGLDCILLGITPMAITYNRYIQANLTKKDSKANANFITLFILSIVKTIGFTKNICEAYYHSFEAEENDDQGDIVGTTEGQITL